MGGFAHDLWGRELRQNGFKPSLKEQIFFCTTTFYNIFLQLLFYCSKIVSVTENLFDVLCFGYFGLMILSPLADGSRDLSQAVDKITVAKAEQVFQK